MQQFLQFRQQLHTRGQTCSTKKTHWIKIQSDGKMSEEKKKCQDSSDCLNIRHAKMYGKDGKDTYTEISARDFDKCHRLM